MPKDRARVASIASSWAMNFAGMWVSPRTPRSDVDRPATVPVQARSRIELRELQTVTSRRVQTGQL